MKLQSISNADMLVVIFLHITASSACPSVEVHRVLTKIASSILISALIGQFFEAVASGALPEATAVHYPRHYNHLISASFTAPTGLHFARLSLRSGQNGIAAVRLLHLKLSMEQPLCCYQIHCSGQSYITLSSRFSEFLNMKTFLLHI
jgi:hypothetical protein